jgi:hypothetical protein
MSEPDPLLTPMDLKRRDNKFGVALQRKYRKAGGFIPHIVLGNRIFYRTSSVEKWLAEQEAKVRGGATNDD